MDIDPHDKARWIDTSAMICDPLTKSGNDKFYERLEKTCRTGLLNLEADVSSQSKKLKQQKMRSEKRQAKS